jgi:hypothetical protein
MIEPPGSASDSLLMMQFADQWSTANGSDVAFMSSAGLHAHGHRKGWNWVTQEVTDGMAARFEDVEEISGEPTLAYILGHGVDGSERPLILVRGVVARDPDGVIRWPGDVPEGLVGAPVFSTRLIGDGDIKVVCLGVVLPGARNNVIATFDSIRTAIASTIPSGLG